AHRRSRTRDAVGAVRHVFLEADHDGRAVLEAIAARKDLPPPSYVLHSSPNRVHVFWRPSGFTVDEVESLQKLRRTELPTDPAMARQLEDVHTVSVCVRLTTGSAPSDGDALPLVAEWNARCQPPWSERKRLHKLCPARQ